MSGDWNTAANWDMGVPNGSEDIATFGFSNTTRVSISANTEVKGIVFTAAAPVNRYLMTANPGFTLTISGTGITNNSSPQNFGAQPSDVGASGHIEFTNNASAGIGGFNFFSSIGAINPGGQGGIITFSDNSHAANSSFFSHGATVAGAGGGSIIFDDTSHADSANLIALGGTNGGQGGKIMFQGDFSHADSATLTALGGTNGGGGGTIRFLDDSDGGRMAVKVFGNGSLFVTANIGEFTIGSIEGSGNVSALDREIVVGGNNRNTEFSGVIQTGAAFSKVGTGRLTLSEGGVINTGNAFINEGVLQVNGSLNPEMGSTEVSRGATLEGTGTIQAQHLRVLRVTNSGTVSPGKPGAPGVLTVDGDYLDANSFATLMIQIAGKSDGQFSVLDVSGDVGVGGILEPALLNGFIPTLGDSFVFLYYESHDGKFSNIRDPLPGDGLIFKVDY